MTSIPYCSGFVYGTAPYLRKWKLSIPYHSQIDALHIPDDMTSSHILSHVIVEQCSDTTTFNVIYESSSMYDVSPSTHKATQAITAS